MVRFRLNFQFFQFNSTHSSSDLRETTRMAKEDIRTIKLPWRIVRLYAATQAAIPEDTLDRILAEMLTLLGTVVSGANA